MRPLGDGRGRLDGFGEIVLGIATELAYIAALLMVGAFVCVAFLVIHA